MKLATLYRLGGRMVPQSRAVISGVMRPSFPFFFGKRSLFLFFWFGGSIKCYGLFSA